MSRPFEGVSVVEIAGWTFVPAAGAILADLGADVIKVEPPTGDPQRLLRNLLNQDDSGPNPFLEIPNHGKRSVTLDLTTSAGRELLLRLVADADVFLTSYLPALRTRLGIDVDDLRAVNPRLVYVRGRGWGSRGPMVNTGGYDSAAAWSSSGTLHKLTGADDDDPVAQPAAFYDLQGSNTIAGAVAMALYRRERTGQTAVVDVSLLNTGMWALGADIAAAPFTGEVPRADRRAPGNPIANYYRTKDGRWINLVCLQADRFWDERCLVLDRPELVADPRFLDAAARFTHNRACVEVLDGIFAERTLDEWRETLAGFSGVWAPALTPAEVHDHVQVRENGYLSELTAEDGTPFRVVAPPYQFDGEPARARTRAPDLGADTEQVLRDLGLDAATLDDYRAQGAFG
ncbi:CaiB/BaiF CoA transferase family protein [Candidatus Frankia alpina]|uniref:CoA transferase n=1 Tax=Candidatus Frankia alpina TaxID=2699483 RepID=A0A4S5ESI0_9ACTN|nr:CoA transferase [Candidatus Frankia alpina]THJ75356.1 CoA transferase [Candidatus Frankia alpina]